MPCLTIENPLIGGLGNQLFQVNFASQIATRIQVPLMIKKSEVLKMSNLRVELASGLGLKLRKMQILDKNFILQQDSETIYSRCLSIVSEGRIAVLPAGILGEVFFKFLCENPRNIFNPRKHLVSSDGEKQNSLKKVALHFRGGDFSAWKPSYVMDYQFYVRVLERLNLPSSQVDLFTDDPSHPTVIRLKTEMKVGRVIHSNNPHRDFWAMSNYGTLVISPSTFSVWAALLGCSKDVIYNGKWYESEGAKEVFWPKFIENDQGFAKKLLSM